MLRQALGATAIVALVLASRSLEVARAGPNPAPPPALQDMEVNRQPVLLCDASGTTWLGPVQSTVVVWSDGDVCYSWKEAEGGFEVGSTHLKPKALNALVTGLVDADAWVLPDQWPQVMDVPLLTVTVLDPTSDASAHTFSYWLGHGPYAAVDTLMDRLLAKVHEVK